MTRSIAASPAQPAPATPSRASRALLAAAALLLAAPAAAQEGATSGVPEQIAADLPASDAQACLACHRFPGLSRLDHESGELHLYFTSERYYMDRAGPHARLDCVQCHDPEAVEQVPHDEVPPVDCSQACHLDASNGTSVQFSHGHIGEHLEKSVHSAEAMSGLPWQVAPLHEGQSSCLYCHDEPVFSRLQPAGASHRGLDPETRCSTCHDDGLGVDVTYALKHTSSRLVDARPVQQAAEVCAVCHSNPDFFKEMESHDAVSSYVRSFHGKASLLGSPQTATCQDCHQTETGDIHGMLSKDDPASQTNAENLQQTCRSAQCHPNAVPELSAAGVHLEVDPQQRTAEYWLILGFVGLIAVELGMHFVLALLELINSIVRREGIEELREISAVRAIRRTRQGRRMFSRMTVSQRIQHWLLVATFGLLVLTGMPMRFAGNPASEVVANMMGGIAALRILHRVAGVGLFLVFGFHLVYLGTHAVREFRRRRAENPSQNPVWALKDTLLVFPLIPNLTDVKQFGQMYLYLMGLKKERPHRAKYHFSQKVEYWAVFWGMGIIGLSGLMMWGTNWVPGLVGGRALNFAIIVHSYEAFLAMMYIVIAHIYAVIFAPSVFPLSLGAITGQSPARELIENHLGHVEDVAHKVGITEEDLEEVEHPTKAGAWALRIYALALIAPVAILGTWSGKYLVDQTLGRTQAVDVASMPVRLDETVLASTDGARSEGFRRGPMAHFHQIPSWLNPDPGNTCAGAGCHDALPHGERKEDRAFLNMHSTFVECQTCHIDSGLTSDDLLWVTTEPERKRRDPPAVLLLATALSEPLAEAEAPAARTQHDALVALLKQAVAESQGDPELSRWLLDLTTSRVGGPTYRLHIDEMRHGIYLHGHGEYGAKVGIPTADPRTWRIDGDKVAAAAALRADDGTLPEAQRDQLVDTLHQGLKRPEVLCTRCHSDDPELVDFSKLGYAQARVDALRSNSIVRQSQAVEKGEVFYLPRLLQDEAEAAQATAPTTEETR